MVCVISSIGLVLTSFRKIGKSVKSFSNLEDNSGASACKLDFILGKIFVCII